jgi:solute carrier family 12 (sodium/potassium/chloride transporter), member 2
MAKAEHSAAGKYAFGTFKGVYLPSVLTILGVIMYLRFGWVLGQVGLAETLIIVTIASSITFLTGLSLAALATNMRIGGGGAYFIISRSLGIEAGAAVGLPLYFAQTLGISFYITGFSESVCTAFPGISPQVVGCVTLVAISLLAYFSADAALKSQLLILALIIASLASFFLGGPVAAPESAAAAMPRLSFWAVFAVFFPAVTGIEAGIAMSGDLKRPDWSLPVGTILAVLTGYAVYLAIPIFLHATVASGEMLLADPLVMQRVARWGGMILAGVWAASLSSAMGSLLGAPRTLQALARDRIAPRFIGRGFGEGGDPRIATATSFLIALAGILLGDLNLIAPVLSMFFLTSYGLLNLSAGMEELMSHPSWRPKFRIPSGVSLVGFALCAGAMFMINPGATFLAAGVAIGVYTLMKRRKLRSYSGDMRHGLMLYVAREVLYRIAGRTMDERSWAPNILVLSGSPAQRWYLIDMADALVQGRGFLTIASFIPSSGWTAERSSALTESIRAHVTKKGIRAFVRVRQADNPLVGAQEMVSHYGFGPLTPNTVLIGETEHREQFAEFSKLIQRICRMKCNLIILREGEERTPEKGEPRIDIWWQGEPRNIGFMVALAYLLRRDEAWEETRLAIKMIVDHEDACEGARAKLEAFQREARIGGEVETFVLARESLPVFDIIRGSSRTASLVLLGMRAPGDDESVESYAAYYQKLLEQTEGLPATALTIAAENLPFLKMFEGEV